MYCHSIRGQQIHPHTRSSCWSPRVGVSSTRPPSQVRQGEVLLWLLQLKWGVVLLWPLTDIILCATRFRVGANRNRECSIQMGPQTFVCRPLYTAALNSRLRLYFSIPFQRHIIIIIIIVMVIIIKEISTYS